MGNKMSPTYEADFVRADLTFRYQRIYNPDKGETDFLNPIASNAFAAIGIPLATPENWASVEERTAFLGRALPAAIATDVAKGLLCPNGLVPFHEGGDAGASAVGALSGLPTETACPPGDRPSQPPSRLPFEIILDRTARPRHSAALLGGGAHPLTLSHVTAPRVTLKRTIHASAAQSVDGGEDCRGAEEHHLGNDRDVRGGLVGTAPPGVSSGAAEGRAGAVHDALPLWADSAGAGASSDRPKRAMSITDFFKRVNK